MRRTAIYYHHPMLSNSKWVYCDKRFAFLRVRWSRRQNLLKARVRLDKEMEKKSGWFVFVLGH